MSQWGTTNLNVLPLSTQTDADSPWSQFIADKIRLYIEQQMMLSYAVGSSGSVSAITTGSNTVITVSASSYTDDEHDGRTLLITTGLAKGYLYTIDATSSGTTGNSKLTLTGDNAYADGVRATDGLKLLYDQIANTDGHDHDAINSKEVVLADSQVTQAKLKTAQSSANSAVSATDDGYVTIPGGEYSFSHQFKVDSGVASLEIYYGHSGNDAGPTTYVQRVNMYNGTGSQRTLYVQSRYVQSSGEVFWIMIKRDKVTKEIKGMYQGPDHPCWGYGGDPVVLPHPFHGYDSSIHEIIVINPSFNEITKIKTDAKKNNLDPLEVIANDYDIDDSVEVAWPDKDVSVDLEEDFYTGKKTVKKMKIPKPPEFKCYKLKKKGS